MAEAASPKEINWIKESRSQVKNLEAKLRYDKKQTALISGLRFHLNRWGTICLFCFVLFSLLVCLFLLLLEDPTSYERSKYCPKNTRSWNSQTLVKKKEKLSKIGLFWRSKLAFVLKIKMLLLSNVLWKDPNPSSTSENLEFAL